MFGYSERHEQLSIDSSFHVWFQTSQPRATVVGWAVPVARYWGTSRGSCEALVTGGGFHLPVNASAFGAYRRIVKLKAPFGAGSQFATLSEPGFSFRK
jgi:hypothetical protein